MVQFLAPRPPQPGRTDRPGPVASPAPLASTRSIVPDRGGVGRRAAIRIARRPIRRVFMAHSNKRQSDWISNRPYAPEVAPTKQSPLIKSRDTRKKTPDPFNFPLISD